MGAERKCDTACHMIEDVPENMLSSDQNIYSESSFAHNKRSRRFTERLESSLWVDVHGRDALDASWIQRGCLVDASRSGARLMLAHEVEPCQLLHLAMPIPAEMRCYDEDKEIYEIWALVRSVSPLTEGDSEVQAYEVGVAFIGKNAPASYRMNSAARYEPLPAPGRNGLWAIRQRPRIKDPDA